MARLTISEQIKQLEGAQEDYPEYNEPLKLQKCIMQTLINIEDYLLNNNGKYIINEITIRKKNELQKNLPIIDSLDAEIFREERFQKAVENIISCLRGRNGTTGLDNLVVSLKRGEMTAFDGFKASLKEDADWFREMGNRFGLDDSLLLLIFSTPMRPFFEELARSFEGEIKERWFKPKCPVCGRIPIVARVRDRKRYMTCSYCGLEYLIDPFLCVHCGNNEPGSLGFITIKDNPQFEISYCEKCKHYVKILLDERVGKKIPSGLEDLLTQDLDALASENEIGLKRA